MPAKGWVDGLDSRGKARLLAAITVIETSMRSGRPPAGRASRVDQSKQGLWELRVTAAGGSPPHLRIFYLRRGQTLWAAAGFTKQKNGLTKNEIRAGDALAEEWLGGPVEKSNQRERGSDNDAP
jgi:hypothetical protein